MARRTTPTPPLPSYGKRATTYDQQVDKLRGYNLVVTDETKAREHLADIGYYRLGFYLHPFELTYPRLDNRRSRNVRPGTKIEDVVALYYFDFDLRNILNRYLSRIEIALRSTMVNVLSLKHRPNSFWYVDPAIVGQRTIDYFRNKVYTDTNIKGKKPIQRFHNKYSDSFAPAWKTFEFMTFGNLEAIFGNLTRTNDQTDVSDKFGVTAPSVFSSYITALREVRNCCAHGGMLFDLTLDNGITAGVGPLSFARGTQNKISGALKVIDYLLGRISENRRKDMWNEIYLATYRLYRKVPSLQPLIEQKTGIHISMEKMGFKCNRANFRKKVKKLINECR